MTPAFYPKKPRAIKPHNAAITGVALAIGAMCITATALAQDAQPANTPQAQPESDNFNGTIIISDAINDRAVSIYRAPDRDADEEMDLDYLEGYAVIREKRSFYLPKGRVMVRFTGVSSGMDAQSAVITGLPATIVEKNRDRKLLTPAALANGHLGNRIMIRRTNKATGAVTQSPAIIRSRMDNGFVIESNQGVEVLNCSGLPEMPVYDGVPQDLFAEPTLSIILDNEKAQNVDMELTYFASGFDWSANYVAHISDDDNLQLFAWATLANQNAESLPDAEIMAIAGKPNMTQGLGDMADRPEYERVSLSCWPQGSTADGVPVDESRYRGGMVRKEMMPPPPVALAYAPPAVNSVDDADVIMVTANRVKAQQEDLGDLKLYRIPFRSTVAANGQKQLVMINQPKVDYHFRYIYDLFDMDIYRNPQFLERELRLKNDEEKGLGLPLPQGQLALMTHYQGRDYVLGQGNMRDYAKGENVKITLGDNDGLAITLNVAEDSPILASSYSRSYYNRYDLKPGKTFEIAYKLSSDNMQDRLAVITIGELADYSVKNVKGGKLIKEDGQYKIVTTIPGNDAVDVSFKIQRRN